MFTHEELRDFYAGKRDNHKPAKLRGWDAGSPAQVNSYDNLKGARMVAVNDNEEALRDAA